MPQNLRYYSIVFIPFAMLAILHHFKIGTSFLHPKVLWQYLYFFALMLLNKRLYDYALVFQQKKIYLFFLGGMLIRFFVSLILLTIYLVYSNDSKILLFTLNFIFLYFLTIAFEIVEILSNLRRFS
jgi:hypothetical protein